jgi:hypothetical protein
MLDENSWLPNGTPREGPWQTSTPLQLVLHRDNSTGDPERPAPPHGAAPDPTRLLLRPHGRGSRQVYDDEDRALMPLPPQEFRQIAARINVGKSSN